MDKEVGLRISNLRKSLNMTKVDFAKLIGISGQYLGKVESGMHGLSIDSLISLCVKTNTSADYILFGIEPFTDASLKNIFTNINKAQINNAFNVLESIALFIKNRS